MNDSPNETGERLLGYGCLLVIGIVVAGLTGIAFVIWAVGWRILNG